MRKKKLAFCVAMAFVLLIMGGCSHAQQTSNENQQKTETTAEEISNTFNVTAPYTLLSNSLERADSWNYLRALYDSNYLVCIGIRNFDNISKYDCTKQFTVNDSSYIVAFENGLTEYADNEQVAKIIGLLIQQTVPLDTVNLSQDTFFTVRSIQYNADPDALLKEMYQLDALAEFEEMVNHYKSSSVIKELLYKASEDEQDIYFLLLAEKIPNSFDSNVAEEIARKAATNKNIMILSALERFLPNDLYKELLKETLDLQFSFN